MLETGNRYRGPIRAVIFDWAGTILDYGCCAPAGVFVEAFRRFGVEITSAEAREPMGVEKREHVARVARMGSVSARFRAVHGRDPSEEDIEAVYQVAVPLQIACLPDYSDLIPGALDVVTELQARGIGVGSCTGYVLEMMEVLVPEAAKRGYRPDSWVCPTDVPRGRPAPHMALLNAIRLNAPAVAACVKVGDTVADIDEGLNAGMWTVGVTVTGNETGLSLPQWMALSEEEQGRRRLRAEGILRRAGAHYLVDSVADILPILDEISVRLEVGETP